MSDVPSRRRAEAPRRRLDVTLVLAVVLPLVAVALLLAAGTEPDVRADRPPTTTPLTRAALGCPSGLPGADEVRVVSGTGAAGSVSVGAQQVEVAPGRPGAAEVGDAVVVRGQDELAPGLVAARGGVDPLVATDCPAPTADQWFTGLGADARHSSVIELVNANAGPAVADVLVLDGEGVVDAPALRGVLVPGGESRRLELARLIPRSGDLAVRVTTTRGRLTAAVEDTEDRLGSAVPSTDWLGGQDAAESTSTLLGAPPGNGPRTLVLANPGDDELRVQVRMVTADSVFAPEGLQEVRVAPRSTARVQVSSELRAAVADGAYGLQVTATAPVTASLRAVVGGDVVRSSPVERVTASTVALVPRGTKQLQLGDATAVGTVTVVARDASGAEVAREDVPVTPGTGGTLDLPRSAVLVEVTPAQTAVRAAILITGDGAAVLRLRDLVSDGPVPQVGPGLP